MNQVAVRAEGLGKCYRLGTDHRFDTLRDFVSSGFKGALGGRARRAPQEHFWALRDVSFEVREGEVLGIIGRNGAGKSTLLKILSRITEPSEGSAEIRGQVGALLEIGTGFHLELTGRENVFLNGAVLGMTRHEVKAKFDEIADFAGVDQFLDTPVKRYSSGMMTRLGFAVAAHLEPEVLIVDEVLAVGDAEFQKRCLGKMKDVAGHGRTVLFVSHNMNAVQQLCGRAIWLDAGQVQMESDDVREVTLRYLNSGENRGSAEWVNPGDQYQDLIFVPRRFFVGDPEGAPVGGPISNTDEVYVYIDADLKELDPALTVGYAIYAEQNQLLYWSYQTDRAPEERPVLKPGPLRLRSPLPRRLFNQGRYRLELIGGLHFREWAFEPGVNAPAITIEIQGGLSDSPLWIDRRAGLLAPALPWNCV